LEWVKSFGINTYRKKGEGVPVGWVNQSSSPNFTPTTAMSPDKIRQQLQVLRDLGILGSGEYHLT